MKQNYLTSILVVAVWLLLIPTAQSQNSTTIQPTKVVEMKFIDKSKPMSEVAEFSKKRSMLEAKVINNKIDFREDPNMDRKWADTDPIVQDHINALRAGDPNTVEQVLPGVSNDDNQAINGFLVAPPDTQGDAGLNHYVQMTNLLTIIYNKDGSVALGPFPNSNFWTGAVIDGIDFSNENSGDPIVLYDEYEDRWLVSHFSTTYNYVLFAISVTGDPTGAYYRYGMAFPNFPDYPKFGIWNDGIYFTVNEFAGSFMGSSLVGFAKAGLYAGTGSSGFYLFLDTNTYPAYGSWLPADADGPTPPPNSTHYTLSRSYGVANTMHLITTEPDWVTPANTVITITDFTVDPYFTSSTIFNAQPNGQQLASLGDRLMYRLQYRNFGTHQAMVVNQSVQNTAGGPFGIRWYELRAASGGNTWSTHQSGTFLPSDGENRWMGSIAMNGAGEIALGYSVSSSSTHPSIRFTGQSAAASGTGVMDLPETSIFTGTASQAGISRWGDYSMMSVDPSDDETFWYTQENGTGAHFGWATQIAEITLGDPQDPAMIAVTPPSLTFNVPTDGSASDLLNIANIALPGDEDLDWTISLAAPPPPPSSPELQVGNGIQLPPVPEGSIVRNDNYQASIGAAPLEGRAIAEQDDVHPIMGAMSAVTVYGIRFSPAPESYSMFDAATPGTYTDISPWPGSAVFTNASEIDMSDHNYMFEIDHSGVMRKVNLTDGTFTTLGNVGIVAHGMGVDHSTGIYYAIDDNSLYTIDVVNATATLVGGLGAGAGNLMIAMTFDNAGNLYMYDVASDNMWSCDKATGACTVIGPIGFDANFGQGMAWDEVNGQVVLSAFNNTTFEAEYRVADLITGNTAFVGKIGPPAELTQFGTICMPAGPPPPGPCDWLTVAPMSGTTAGGSSDNVTVSVDATGLPDGVYECQLNISSNADNASMVVVPVTMTVGAECPITATPLPFFEGFEELTGGVALGDGTICGPSYYWSFETTHQGQGRASYGDFAYMTANGVGAVTMDRKTSGANTINYATLTVDLSNYASATDLELSFNYADHGDESGPNDKVWIRGNLTEAWVEVLDMDPGNQPDDVFQSSGIIDIDAVLAGASQAVSGTTQIRFGQEGTDPYPGGSSPAPSDGITIDDISMEQESLPCPIPAITLPYFEGFELISGTTQNSGISCFSEFIWEYQAELEGEGRLRYGTDAFQVNNGIGAATLDRYPTGAEQTNMLILTLNLSNYAASTDLELAFSYADHEDKTDPNDKVWVRGSTSDDWVMIYDLNPGAVPDDTYIDITGLDIDDVLANAVPSQTVSGSFQLRFGQQDNYPAPTDGISFDDISVTENASFKLAGFDDNDAKQDDGDINIYAFQKTINIRSAGDQADVEKEVWVYDMYGRTVLHTNLQPSSLDQLKVDAQGYLVVKVISGSTITTEKVMVR